MSLIVRRDKGSGRGSRLREFFCIYPKIRNYHPIHDEG